MAGRAVYAAHRALYRATGGKVGHRTSTGPILLLTTTGRRSGRHRTTPLLYMADGDDWVVVASNAGRPDHPAWFLNLRANPDAEVQVGGDRFPVKAEVATGEAEERLWPLLHQHYAGFAHYQTLTDRQIPAVVLRRRR